MVITLTGTNDYLLKQALQQLTADFIEKYGDIGLERQDGDSLDSKQLASSLQALPFLADKRMVVLRSPSSQKSTQEALEKLLTVVADSTDLVIVEPKLDKRTSYYKALKKQTEFREFNQPNEGQLAEWLVAQASRHKASLSRSDAVYLVSRVGANQMLLASELKKLTDYSSNINRTSIDLLTEPTPQSSIFDLLDAALKGQVARTLQLYQDQRQQKVEPLAILALLAWQLHILALIKTAGQRSPSQIASQAKISPYVVSKSQAIAQNFSLPELKDTIKKAADLDVRLKSQAIDADEALLQFLLTIS